MTSCIINGSIADTDPTFVKHERSAPFRELHKRMETVYHKHAATMHAANHVLPVDQLTSEEHADIHMANEFL